MASTLDHGLRRVAFVGSSLPRRCGIATFSADLRQALEAHSPSAEFLQVAVTDAAPDTVEDGTGAAATASVEETSAMAAVTVAEAGSGSGNPVADGPASAAAPSQAAARAVIGRAPGGSAGTWRAILSCRDAGHRLDPWGVRRRAGLGTVPVLQPIGGPRRGAGRNLFRPSPANA